jgi:hypothetical protein
VISARDISARERAVYVKTRKRSPAFANEAEERAYWNASTQARTSTGGKQSESGCPISGTDRHVRSSRRCTESAPATRGSTIHFGRASAPPGVGDGIVSRDGEPPGAGPSRVRLPPDCISRQV